MSLAPFQADAPLCAPLPYLGGCRCALPARRPGGDPGRGAQAARLGVGENFPVASTLIAPKHRSVILAYYRFARGADDVEDSPWFLPDTKLALLDLFESTR